MRGTLLILLAVFLVSCSNGQSLGDFVEGATLQSESKVNPLFKAKDLAQAHGDGKLITVTLKVPLTKNSIGSYDFSEIMENEDLDDENRGWCKRLFDTLFYNLANISFKFGQRNKYSVSTGMEFPEIDPEYVKEVRIKKLFFSLEECDPEDERCVDRQTSKPPSLNFLKSFFLNISPLGRDEQNLLEETKFVEWDKRFNSIRDKAFVQEYHENFKNYMKSFMEQSNRNYYEVNDSPYAYPELFNNLNVARLRNTKKLRETEENIRDNGKIFLFRLKKNITSYRKAEIRNHFRKKKFDGIIEDITILGDNLVVELYQKESRRDFFKVLKETVQNVDELDIKSFEGCSYENCANIAVNSINLVPLLDQSYKLKFDTFLELRYLEINDFLYNGFVEIEIKLDLPI